MVDRRAVYYEIGEIRFPPPQSYDDVSNDDIIGIAATPWFRDVPLSQGLMMTMRF